MEIAKSAIGSGSPIEKFNFEILLRDKYPFQPPMVMTKTRFGKPAFADGRDLLEHVLPDGEKDWRPDMTI